MFCCCARTAVRSCSRATGERLVHRRMEGAVIVGGGRVGLDPGHVLALFQRRCRSTTRAYERIARRQTWRGAFIVLSLVLLGGCASRLPKRPATPRTRSNSLSRRRWERPSPRCRRHTTAIRDSRCCFRGAMPSSRGSHRREPPNERSTSSTSVPARHEHRCPAVGAGGRGRPRHRVRVLLDDIEPQTRRFAVRVQALGGDVQVRLFNPFWRSGDSMAARIVEFGAAPARLNRRMHNKLWLADNAVAVFGSRNLGDAYFDLDGEANFSDIDLLVVGPVVADLSASFDAYWNSAAAVPLCDVDPRAALRPGRRHPGRVGRPVARVQRAAAVHRLHAPELPNTLRDATWSCIGRRLASSTIRPWAASPTGPPGSNTAASTMSGTR